MNIQEAYKTLGVNENTSDEELKKKYKELAKTFHPDVYKEDPNKFKSINQAHDLIKDYKKNPHKYSSPFSSYQQDDFAYGTDFTSHIQDIFGGNFWRASNQESQRNYNYPPPTINIEITFQESILGCNKSISYKRHIKCNVCDGKATKKISNNCKECDGFGRKVSKSKNMVSQTVCHKCYGHNVKKEECKNCNKIGTVEQDIQGQITVPPGIANGSILKLGGSGSYFGKHFGNNDVYGDAFVNVKVQESNMKLSDKDVISFINIDLLSALKGCNKTIETVYGNKEIIIKPGVKNGEDIRIENCGVAKTHGCHKVFIEIDYPENTTDLIKFLEKKENN